MDAVFLRILNMSIAAGWLILAVVLLRSLLRKAPKWLTCVLWAVVAIRLLCPVTFESALSLIPSAETIGSDILYSQEPAIHSGLPMLNSVVNPVITDTFAPTPGAAVSPLQHWTGIAACVWLAGIVLMLVYAAVSFLRLRKAVGASLKMRDNVWLCDGIGTPFILGILKPRIYLPSGMEEAQQAYAITHEAAHLKRRDHWWKPLGFLLLAVYWFNPLCWLAYLLLCRDIELACDEKVVRSLDRADQIEYSEALFSCSVPRRSIAACPLAFGEVGVKERIKTVLNYKKPAFWIIAAALIACAALAVCFLTNPPHQSGEIMLNHTIYTQKDEKLAELPEGSIELGMLKSILHETSEHPTENFGGANLDKKYAGCTIYQSGTDKNTILLEDFAGYYIPFICAEKPTLSLNDVITLSQKGDALMWSDFDGYSYIETGSGLYIRIYEINAQFSLWIGGVPDEKPMYLRLVSETDQDDYIDIREESVTDFISEHKNDYAERSIQTAIMEYNAGKYEPGEFACESHTILGESSATGPDGTTSVTYYLIALYQEYDLTDGSPAAVSGGQTPAALTFTVGGDEEYTLTEYWAPRDGTRYWDDLRGKFPDSIPDAELDVQKYLEAETASCDMQAREYFSVPAAARDDLMRCYRYDGGDVMHSAAVSLYQNGEFQFSFSPISSYFGFGTYTIENNRLTLRTDDGNYTYVFDMVEDTLVFEADASSDMVWFSGLTDGATFVSVGG